MPPEARSILIGGWPYQNQSITKTTCGVLELERQKGKKKITKKKIRQQKHNDDEDDDEDEDARNEKKQPSVCSQR